MKNLKLLTLGGLFSAFAAVLQLFPVFLTEAFIWISMLSAIPVYLIARKNPGMGVCCFITAAVITFMMSIHQFIFFVCTSGLVGLTLGILRFRFKNITCIVLLSSLFLTIAICFINYVIGIPVFGFALQGNMIMQTLKRRKG
jgi:riboflavin transporter FmnP